MKPRILIRQHRSLEHLLYRLRPEAADRDALRLRLVEELTVHLSTELDVLYPAMRRAGGIVAPSELELLVRAREALGAIPSRRVRAPGFYRGLEGLSAALSRHVHVQETAYFPACAEGIDGSTFERILEDVNIASFRLAGQARLRALRVGSTAS